MPIEIRYNRAKQFLRATAEGPPSLAEFDQAMETISHSDEFPPDVRTLWDLRDLDFTAVDRSLEESIIAVRRRYPKRGETRIAFIVGTELGFGMTRMYQSLADSEATRVFTDYAEGERWLLGE